MLKCNFNKVALQLYIKIRLYMDVFLQSCYIFGEHHLIKTTLRNHFPLTHSKEIFSSKLWAFSILQLKNTESMNIVVAIA